MKVLLVGRWGKTHALGIGLKRNKDVRLFTLMDKKNGSLAKLSEDYQLIDLSDRTAIENYVDDLKPDLVIITPEMTLKTGITDSLSQKAVPTVGASKICSILESDKAFVRRLLQKHKLSVAVDFEVFKDKDSAKEYLKNSDKEYAVKPVGVTEGDGVKVMGKQLAGKEEALAYIDYLFDNNIGGSPEILLEEKLEGEEFTLQAFSDGKKVSAMPPVRDYKLLHEGERGVNTPGMGAYSDANHLLPFLSRTTLKQATDSLEQILAIMKTEHGSEYKGFISGQYMLSEQGLKLIEINVRPGDAEILNIIPLLETDLTEICMAIAEGRLDEIKIKYKHKATVCKYVVPPNFPTPGTKPIKVEIDRDMIAKKGGHLFQSCFDIDDDLYEPSPRLFAVTAVASDIDTARKKCEECLSYIRGEGLFHRKDIGSRKLMEMYDENQKSIC